ncbi:PTS system trehalose-specific EIIBC component [Vaginisenegalia massiliensis]|uniref:PTS system trehalose-specific EIIBC component n=1 Tax=Vaginisenegalia massiliensis TaxID=2058294 RepID=UPI000F523A1F|nr:PTS system trehalose-specific EIIBC component [Vaginisenegalia massiliensis]
MANFKDDAAKMLTLIGGKDNISAVTHCATRMRFALVDPDKADIKAIEALPSVKGSFTQAGQFQVIVGNAVSEFYKEFVALAGVGEATKDDVKKAAEQNQNMFQRAMAFMAEIFAPIIPAIIVGGLILGFRNILEGVPMDFLQGKTIVESSPFWSGVNSFLWLPGEAIFHFLPVGITWSVTRKMGTTQILGIVLGITLVSPQLLNAYGAADALAKGEVPQWDFGLFKLNMIGYQAQVIPAIFAGLTLAYLEKFWRKVVPEVLSMILVPFLALLPAVILAHTILGPIGWKIGQAISSVVYAGLTGSFSWLFGAIFGALYSPLVITGLHHMSNAIDTQLVADFGGTGLWPMIALSNIAQGSAVLGVWWLTRHDENETQITLPSMISAYLGVTEPAMFGVNIKYLYPFVAAMIGSGIAGLIATSTKVTANSIGVGGLPGFLVIQPKSMVMFFVCMAVAIVVPFVLTIFFNKNKILTQNTVEFDIPFLKK